MVSKYYLPKNNPNPTHQDGSMKHKGQTNPPGRRKIIKALNQLMKTKDFHSVTTAEIAATAGVTEGLIYKYFKDKRDLLYQVFSDTFVRFQETILERTSGETSAITKLELIISASIEYYTANRVFARMLLLEVRNAEAYFSSDAYRMVRQYARHILDIITAGIRNRELKAGIDPVVLRKVIIGAIEHACLGEVIFDRPLDAQAITREISEIIFNGAKNE